MNKKLVIIHILIFLSLTVLISAPITSSSQVFRAIIHDSPVPAATAKVTIKPIAATIDDDKNIFTLKNDVVTLDATPYEIFTWEIVASTYSPVTLRFITSPLQKEGDPTHKINFRLDFELEPSFLKDYIMYENNKSWSTATIPLLELTTLGEDYFSGKTNGNGKKKCVYYKNGNKNTYVETPYVYDYVTNVSKEDNSFVASLESTSSNPLEIVYHLKVQDGSNLNPLNYTITRKGIAKISLNMPAQVTYGTYVTPLYVELEVQ